MTTSQEPKRAAAVTIIASTYIPYQWAAEGTLKSIWQNLPLPRTPAIHGREREASKTAGVKTQTVFQSVAPDAKEVRA